ncbi:MAG: DUF4159 domain-containing protein [Planctomycetota bacterium]
MRPVRYVAMLSVGASLLTGLAVRASAWENPKAKAPPRAKPQRRSSGEGLPPLPLPATPLRRSEKKRQPSPPGLVGMINFSEQGFRIVDGERRRVDAFPTTQIDIERLIHVANHRLGVRYRYMPTTLAGFSWDPRELPLLYLTGWTPVPNLSDAMLQRLRRYLYDGGTLVVHAQCGRQEFVKTARRMIGRVLPDRELAPIDTDSPLLHTHFDVSTMRVRRNHEPFKTMKPYLEAMYLGCRPAVIFSPIDLNCGWDVVNHPIEGGTLYHQDDAAKLGVNIIATTLANFEYARAWGTQKIYHQQGERTRDQLVIGQLVHDGDWDPTPHGLPNLMKYVRNNTTLNVQFKREVVDPAEAKVFEHPVLYMTGLRDFAFSDEQVANLRRYLNSGGVLIADAAAGRKAFDAAFRREIARVLPGAELDVLPVDSPVYQMPFAIRKVDYTRLTRANHPALNAPTLEGITIDGQLTVVYSSMSLSNGWEELGFAFARGYSDADALRIGVNLLAYAVTH